MDAVPDEIRDPNFLDAGHRVNRYFRLQIITERGIGHFDDQKRLGRSRMTRNNISIVKNQIRLRLYRRFGAGFGPLRDTWFSVGQKDLLLTCAKRMAFAVPCAG